MKDAEKAKEPDVETMSVKIPDNGYSKKGYVNVRGASLNYVRAQSNNKETAHCSARAD